MTKSKKNLITILFAAIIIVIIIGYILPSSISYSVPLLIGSLLFFLVSIIVFKKENLYRIKMYSVILLILVELIAIGFFIAGIRFCMLAYIAIAGAIGVVFPIFFLFGDLLGDNRQIIFNGFINGTIISYVLYLILSFFLAPITSIEYSSFMGNPNILGTYLIMTFIAAIYKLDEHIKSKDKKWILIGSVIQFIIASLSRTAAVSMIAVSLIYIISIFVCRKTVLLCMKRIVCICITIVIGMTITFALYGKLSNTLKEDTRLGEIAENIENFLGIKIDDGENVGYGNMIKNFENKSMKGLDGSGRFTSGRTEIWEEYIKELNLIGHEKEERRIITPYYNYVVNAHNTYLQISYSIGVLGGITFFSFVVVAGIMSLIENISLLRRRKFCIEKVTILSIIGAFFVNSLVSVGYSPFTYPIVFAFWFSVSCLIQRAPVK